MLQMFYWILHYIFFINLPIDLSIYLFIYPLKSKIVRVLKKGKAEQQKRNIQLNLLVPLRSVFCCVFIGFTVNFFRKCSICILSREYHLSLLTQMMRKYLVMFAVSLILPLDINFML